MKIPPDAIIAPENLTYLLSPRPASDKSKYLAGAGFNLARPDELERARALVRQSAIMAAAAKHKDLKKRTLTNLYNERPTRLRIVHQELDRAVLAAYAAIDLEGHWSEDWAEVWCDTGAGQPLPANHALAAKRAEVDQKVLANLLRLNHSRAGGEAREATRPAKKVASRKKGRTV
jgi:hypothetical protein